MNSFNVLNHVFIININMLDWQVSCVLSVIYFTQLLQKMSHKQEN